VRFSAEINWELQRNLLLVTNVIYIDLRATPLVETSDFLTLSLSAASYPGVSQVVAPKPSGGAKQSAMTEARLELCPSFSQKTSLRENWMIRGDRAALYAPKLGSTCLPAASNRALVNKPENWV
jgi:hypothetical protein